MRRLAWLFMLALAVAGLDVATKGWAERALELHEPVPVLGELARLTLGYNTGVAFGMFQGGGTVLLLVTGAIIVGISAGLLAGRRWEAAPPVAHAMSLILGGAVANFVDRWPDGRVTDFLDVGLGALRWPTFNVADSSIVLGITIILLVTLIPRQLRDAPRGRAPSPDVGRA